jgi:uncharacterized protein YdhG (YjbR/CyaY superfamily)
MRSAASSPSGTRSVPKTVEEYIAGIPEPGRSTLERVRAVIQSIVPPDATETISYQMPAFRYKGALVAYGAFKNHCSLFPMSAALIEEMKSELGKYETAKGTIHFALDKPLSATLIRKIVKARIAQNKKKKAR